MPGKRVVTVGPKRTKGKRPKVNGPSLEGNQKVTTRLAGKSGFGYQGAQMSFRGR